MQTQQGYYAVIPASVRYSKVISDGAKLLYGEITALCDKSGYCWASNAYFADLYGASKRTVSRWISELSAAGFVATIADNQKAEGRKIWLSEVVVDRQKWRGGVDKNGVGYRQKWRDPHDKNVYQNTTVNTTVKRGGGADAPLTPPPAVEPVEPSSLKAETAPKKSSAPPAARAAVPVPPGLAGSVDFMSSWALLIDAPKWRKKPASALVAALKQLEKYPAEFAADLVQKAIAGDYRGVTFSDTPEAYAKWVKARNPQSANQPALRPGPSLKNLPTYGS